MRLWPFWRGETTLRSSHHCNCRKLTLQMRATSLLLNPSPSAAGAPGRDFLPLNILCHFRFSEIGAQLDCTCATGGVNRHSRYHINASETVLAPGGPPPP